MALWLTDSDVPERRFEHDVIRLLADGLLDAAARRLDEQGLPSPFTDVAELDIGARRLEVGLPELQRLQERLRAEPAAHARFGLWADVLVAERLLIDGDPTGAHWAATLLDRVTDEPCPPVPELFARARMQRVAALGFLFEPTLANREAFRRCRDRAVEDFARCGFAVEAAATSAITAGFHFVMTAEQPEEAAARVAAARAVVAGTPGSTWGPVLDAVHGTVMLWRGDTASATVDFARATSGPGHPLARGLARVGRALAGLIDSQGDPASLAAVDDVIARSGRSRPRHAPTVQTMAAHVLADLGRAEMARYARPALDAPRVGPMSERDERLLRLRLDLVGGVVPPAEEVTAVLAEMVELHLDRWARSYALRVARDYDRLDGCGEGEALRRWIRDRLGPPGARAPLVRLPVTTWSPASAGPPVTVGSPMTVTSPTTTAAPAGVVVRVLEPRLVLDAGGTPVRLRPTAAKLLLALVVRHPRPMHLEEVADLLWPGATHDPRPRLNTLVHRLRSAAPGLAATVVRVDDLFAFDGTGCDVDLFAFRAALAGSPEARASALAGVRGNLCEAQFPYDELLVDERRSFAATWLHHARALTAAATDAATEAMALSAASTALGLDVTDLVGVGR